MVLELIFGFLVTAVVGIVSAILANSSAPQGVKDSVPDALEAILRWIVDAIFGAERVAGLADAKVGARVLHTADAGPLIAQANADLESLAVGEFRRGLESGDFRDRFNLSTPVVQSLAGLSDGVIRDKVRSLVVERNAARAGIPASDLAELVTRAPRTGLAQVAAPHGGELLADDAALTRLLSHWPGLDPATIPGAEHLAKPAGPAAASSPTSRAGTATIPGRPTRRLT